MKFPVSGVETSFWVPPLVAFSISLFTSLGGVSGAVLLLPFQMSYLGFVHPAVSATNLVYNIVAIPSGLFRYLREGRMIWPLAAVVVAGTIPGVVGGGWIRLVYLPDPEHFKVFAACVLLYIAVRMIYDFGKDIKGSAGRTKAEGSPSTAGDWKVSGVEFSLRRLAFTFQGRKYEPSLWQIFLLSLGVGMVGGVYGIGGGAIIAPFFVAVFGLPVHAVAAAALMATFVASVAGVSFYELTAPFFRRPGLEVAPDWLLGIMFGLGGMAGMYLGAGIQRRVPARWIKLILGCLVLFVALRYFMEAVHS